MAWLMNRIRKIGTGRPIGRDNAADPSPASVRVYGKTCYIRIEIDQAEPIICAIVKRSCDVAVPKLNCRKSELDVQRTSDQIVTPARGAGFNV